MKRLSDMPQVMTRFLTQNRCRLFSFSARNFSSKINVVTVCFLLAQRNNPGSVGSCRRIRCASSAGDGNRGQNDYATGAAKASREYFVDRWIASLCSQ